MNRLQKTPAMSVANFPPVEDFSLSSDDSVQYPGTVPSSVSSQMGPVSESLVACVVLGSVTAFNSSCVGVLSFPVGGGEDLLDDWFPGCLAPLCLATRSSVANGWPQSLTIDRTCSSPSSARVAYARPLAALCGSTVEESALIRCGIVCPNCVNWRCR